jgi:hypothetical protein
MSGSSETKTDSQQKTDPWGPQAGALTSAFANAQGAYGTASQAKAPTDFVAGMTPEQLTNFRDALGFASGSTVPGQNAATGGALSGAGTSAATGALSGLTNFDPSATNNPAALIDAANKYASGQDINGQVNNAMLNARQTARDVTLPGIEQNAAMTGNTNSSRTGIAEGLVERGLAQQSTDLGASLRSKAFSDGLTLASGNAQANNQQKLGALSTGASAGTNAANSGVAANSQSIQDKNSLLGIANDAGSGLQGANQLTLDNLLKQYQSKVSSPYDALNGLMGIIGTNNWGSNSSGSSTTTKTPSAFEVLGGLLGAAGNAKSLFSDERLKTNIKRVGQLDNGLGIYSYHYTDDPFERTHIGVIAQEAERTHPEAIGEMHGYKTVNYEVICK